MHGGGQHSLGTRPAAARRRAPAAPAARGGCAPRGAQSPATHRGARSPGTRQLFHPKRPRRRWTGGGSPPSPGTRPAQSRPQQPPPPRWHRPQQRATLWGGVLQVASEEAASERARTSRRRQAAVAGRARALRRLSSTGRRAQRAVAGMPVPPGSAAGCKLLLRRWFEQEDWSEHLPVRRALERAVRDTPMMWEARRAAPRIGAAGGGRAAAMQSVGSAAAVRVRLPSRSKLYDVHTVCMKERATHRWYKGLGR